MSFLQSYLPTASELTAAQLADTRTTLAAWLGVAYPTLDTRPGSPFDAHTLQPQALLATALDVALNRFQQDLDVAGVAAGTVFDCDFVERYLLGLGARREESINTVGYVLLVFDADVDVDIPGGVRFQFNGADIFQPLSFPDGVIKVRRMGTARTDAQIYPLTAYSSSTYGVIVPVTGYATAVEAGATAETDTPITNLTAITALSDFSVGRVNNSVPAIARRSQELIHASGFASKGSTRRMLMQVFPDLQGVTALTSGDEAVLRSCLTPLGLAKAGVMDVHVCGRSRTAYTQFVNLTLVVDQDGDDVDSFVGVWTPTEQPLVLQSVKALQAPTVVVEPVIFSRSSDDVRAPLLACAYSALEQLEIVIPMPRADDNSALIPTLTQSDGSRTAWFELTFLADPAVRAVERWTETESPVGVDVLTRSPIPMVIEQLIFYYRIDAGVLLNKTQAADDVSTYFEELFGRRAFSAEDLSDCVYSAGASSISRVQVRARLQLGIADFVSAADADLASVDYTGLTADALQVPKPMFDSLRAMSNVSYTDPALGTADQTLAAASSNVLFVLADSSALQFVHEA